MTALSDRLRQANDERQLSVRDIAAIGGNKVSPATVARYLNGQHPAAPDDDALLTFSSALGIAVGELRRLSGLHVGESAPYIPPTEANQLNARQRRAIDEMIRSIVATMPASTDDLVNRRNKRVKKTRNTEPNRQDRNDPHAADLPTAAAPNPYLDDGTKRHRRNQDSDSEGPDE